MIPTAASYQGRENHSGRGKGARMTFSLCFSSSKEEGPIPRIDRVAARKNLDQNAFSAAENAFQSMFSQAAARSIPGIGRAAA